MKISLKYDDSDIESILSYSRKLVGKTISDILSESGFKGEISIQNKGIIGTVIEEHWFGIKLNSSPKPDFQKVGVELKIIPLIKRKKGLAVKERTKVCSINYTKLVSENWQDSHAKEKLNKVLFIYYLYDKDNISNSEIKKIDLWELNHGNNELIIKNDWINIQRKVVDGLAHELSESDSKVLAASRSGSGGKNKNGKLKDLVLQANISICEEALKRAFSLKQSFTNQRYKELQENMQFESIIDSLDIKDFSDFETTVLTKLNQYEKKSIQELSDIFNLDIKNKSKNQIATIIKKSIGFKSVKSNIKEFEQLGIIVKTIKVRRRDNKPLEAISFPAMELQELLCEEWEESTFKEMIYKILFVPVYHDSRLLKDKYLGKSFFWSPSLKEEKKIKDEWLNYQYEVSDGKCQVEKISNKSKKGFKEVSHLSKESQTSIIHMRPHGRNSDDRDYDLYGNSIVKQSFWLNRSFIQALLNMSTVK